MTEEQSKLIERKVDDLLVELWNDIVNRQAGKVIFEQSTDILSVREQILTIIRGLQTEKPL